MPKIYTTVKTQATPMFTSVEGIAELAAGTIDGVPSSSIDTAKAALAANLTRLREERGWSLTQVMRVSGVKVQLLSMLEGGSRDNPTLETLVGLANGFEVSLDELLGTGPDQEPIPPALQALADSGMHGDITLGELQRLRSARGLLGREPTTEEYVTLLSYIRSRPR